MWTKKQALEAAARGEGCLGRARDDEPVFIVVGDDITMAKVIEHWADEVEEYMEGIPNPKIQEARKFATEVRDWQTEATTVKIPD